HVQVLVQVRQNGLGVIRRRSGAAVGLLLVLGDVLLVILHHAAHELLVELLTGERRKLLVQGLLLGAGLRRRADAQGTGRLLRLLVRGRVILGQRGAEILHALTLPLLLREITYIHFREVALDGLLQEVLIALPRGKSDRPRQDRNHTQKTRPHTHDTTPWL